MRVGWFHDERFLKHDTGPRHPERPDRLRAIVRGFADSGLDKRLHRLPFEAVEPSFLTQIHDRAYVEHVAAAFGHGEHMLDPDTPISDGSYEAARLASGAVWQACQAVLDGTVERAFCSVRPPGHHAERDRAMGFCLFNHVAVAADALIRSGQAKRVAIVDFDVHHGNGTQHAFEDRPDVLFVSIHEGPNHLYPGTGFASEIGTGTGRGFTLNVPMPPGSGDEQWIAAFDDQIVPKLDAYRPDFLLISAGFDAAAEDPLAHIELTDAAFGQFTQRLDAIAQQHCAGRIVSTLEGGYDLRSLSRGVNAHVTALFD